MTLRGRLEATPLLELIQILAYSRKTGLLTVEGGRVRGEVAFQEGNVVCAHSTDSLSLLVKAAKETDPERRFSLRRIQVLTALGELFDIPQGDYRFAPASTPVVELEGLDIRMFYADGALDTGDLLVALEKAMVDEADISRAEPGPSTGFPHQRQHQRFGPIIIKGELACAGMTLSGLITNVSMGGTFFHADEAPPLDAVGELRFDLPGDLGSFQARARVAWLRSEGPNTKKGAGLAFEPLTTDAEQKLAAYLKGFQELATDVDA